MNPHERLRLPSVEADLARLETLLAESVIFGDDYLDSVTTHLIYAGGKRLRPMLAIASATGGERPATRDDLLGGVALELMHLASLYHDDVMDEAEVRRNVDTVNARYGNLIAIVAGDYLMARSAGIAADLGTEVAGPARADPGLADPRPGLRGAHRLLGRAHRGRLLRGDRGQDRVADGVELPRRRAHRGTRHEATRRAHRVRALLRHGLPAARRRPRPRRDRQPAGQARRARTSPRASTPCRRSSRCATTTVGDELRARPRRGPSTTRTASERASWSSPPTASRRPWRRRRASSTRPARRSTWSGRRS